MLGRIGNRQCAARTATAGTIGFVIAAGGRCGLAILVGLIALINRQATRRAIGTVTRCGITLTIAAIAIGIARDVPITVAAIALLIPVLVTAIGAVTVALGIALGIAIATVTAIGTVSTIVAVIAPVIAPVALIGIDPIIGHAFDITVEILIIAVFELIVLAAPGLIFLKARPRFGKHAEIMISELQIIFGVDPVALHLGVARQRLVFLEQLGRIAARPIINAIAVFGTTPRIATTLRALPATTATAAGLTIVDQVLLSSCLKFKTGVAP